jgi:hypothetical protein
LFLILAVIERLEMLKIPETPENKIGRLRRHLEREGGLGETGNQAVRAPGRFGFENHEGSGTQLGQEDRFTSEESALKTISDSTGSRESECFCC